jgi:hypothetical protein
VLFVLWPLARTRPGTNLTQVPRPLLTRLNTGTKSLLLAVGNETKSVFDSDTPSGNCLIRLNDQQKIQTPNLNNLS